MQSNSTYISRFILAVIAIQIFYSCNHESPERVIYYQQSVKPIIESSCAVSNCHVAGFMPGDFTTYEGIREKVVKGSFQQLVIIQRIMPPDIPLREEDIQTIDQWIKSGYPDN